MTIGWGQLRPIIDWCEINCKSDWGYNCVFPAGRDAGFYEFYFETEPDYVNFILWKK